jgi:flagellar biosynthesis anti-sigma factor FlgM
MRVDFTNLGVEQPERKQTGRVGQSGTAPAATSANEGATSTAQSVDRARFSFDQAKVHALEAKALAAPEVRQEKVEPLQQAVSNGSYAVDSGRVAEAIAAEHTSGRVR